MACSPYDFVALQASQLSDSLVELLLSLEDVEGARDAVAQCLSARMQVRNCACICVHACAACKSMFSLNDSLLYI